MENASEVKVGLTYSTILHFYFISHIFAIYKHKQCHFKSPSSKIDKSYCIVSKTCIFKQANWHCALLALAHSFICVGCILLQAKNRCDVKVYHLRLFLAERLFRFLNE